MDRGSHKPRSQILLWNHRRHSKGKKRCTYILLDTARFFFLLYHFTFTYMCIHCLCPLPSSLLPGKTCSTLTTHFERDFQHEKWKWERRDSHRSVTIQKLVIPFTGQADHSTGQDWSEAVPRVSNLRRHGFSDSCNCSVNTSANTIPCEPALYSVLK
jgi:hypothetical protein